MTPPPDQASGRWAPSKAARITVPCSLWRCLWHCLNEACEGFEHGQDRKSASAAADALRSGVAHASAQLWTHQHQVEALQAADRLLDWIMATYHCNVAPDDPQMSVPSLYEIAVVLPQAEADLKRILASACVEGGQQRDHEEWMAEAQQLATRGPWSLRRVMFVRACALREIDRLREMVGMFEQTRRELQRGLETGLNRIEFERADQPHGGTQLSMAPLLPVGSKRSATNQTTGRRRR